MKATFIRNFCFIFIMISCPVLSSYLWTLPNQEQDPIVEEVAVYNVEVPVRVLYKGKPVLNLTKEDFSVYENKKQVKVNGFFVKRKIIKINSQGEATPSSPVPRTFVLTFSVTRFTRNFQEAVEHLFDNILQPTDHVIIFANDVTREYTQLDDISSLKYQVINDLKKESYRAHQRLTRYIHQIESQLNVAQFRGDLIRFLQDYDNTWNEYKKRYLTPPSDRFYYFARYLKKVQGEKYVLNFYQFELFPKIRFSSRTMERIRKMADELLGTNDGYKVWQGNMINKLLNQILADYELSKGFPNEEIAKLFYNVDATFHSFFIRALVPSVQENFEYRVLASDLEKVLKGITDVTGGKSITSNNLVKSLDVVSEIEDAYYILTYIPHDPKKAGKLKIKVNNKKYKVLYDDNFRVDYINEYLQKLEEKIKTPDIKIENFSFDRKILAFTVKDYLLKENRETGNNGKMTKKGLIKVRIRVKNENNPSLFDQEKKLTAQKDEMEISLGAFQSLKKGEYDFFIDAVDIFTGKEVNIYQKIKIR
jgi:hypothetical protein